MNVFVITSQSEYYTGDPIQGHILIKCDTEHQHSGITVVRKVSVRLSKFLDVRHEVLFYEEEEFLKGPSGLPKGEHLFPFEWRLPEAFLPTVSYKFDMTSLSSQVHC